MTEKVLLKDTLFNKSKINKIADEIHRVYPPFKRDEFVRDVSAKFPELELKARISWIAACLRKYLPENFHPAVDILIKALPAPNNPHLSDDDFGDFIYAPYAEYVAKNGCTKEHLRLSFHALYEITQRFSAEDAIRYFINTYPAETLKELSDWAKDSHYHVRRLCSEGTRPKLPWSQKINIPVTTPLIILDNLFSDKTRFVTRSVANHINDISKINPELAINTLQKWQNSGRQEQEEMNYIIRHALRTLVKQGNPEAMTMLGFPPNPQTDISNFTVPKTAAMNTTLEFSFTIKSKTNTRALIDYTLYFQNKTGKLNSKKVFKLTQLSLVKNKPFVIAKRHALRERMTTRTLYPGKHEITIQVNGKMYAKKSFVLTK
jgi:3-methyladenine DNA glycosylase AlkC